MPEANQGGGVWIAGPDNAWRAFHDRSRLATPSALWLSGEPALSDAIVELGDLTDDLALVASVRSARKANVRIVTASGKLPYGAGIRFRHTCRYGSSFLRVNTDLRLPAGSRIRNRLGIGCLTLASRWREYRLLQEQGGELMLGAWQSLNAAAAAACDWGQDLPLAMVFRDAAGVELEIGTGSDLWRWQAGVLPGTGGVYALRPAGERWRLERYVTAAEGDLEPAPRAYRFSWYMAWSVSPQLEDVAAEPMPELMWDGAQIDADWLRGLRRGAGQGGVTVDLDAAKWPASLRRGGGRAHPGADAPCLAGNAANTRLKRILRQLAGASVGTSSLQFRHVRPGCCSVGRHVQAREARRHWDTAQWLEFGRWTRRLFGEDCRIVCNPGGLDCPSMRNLFARGEASDVAADGSE